LVGAFEVSAATSRAALKHCARFRERAGLETKIKAQPARQAA